MVIWFSMYIHVLLNDWSKTMDSLTISVVCKTDLAMDFTSTMYGHGHPCFNMEHGQRPWTR